MAMKAPKKDNPRKDRDHARSKATKDPSAGDKTKISKPGVRTMKPDKGKGLPAPPLVHPHRRRNAKRQERAK